METHKSVASTTLIILLQLRTAGVDKSLLPVSGADAIARSLICYQRTWTLIATARHSTGPLDCVFTSV